MPILLIGFGGKQVEICKQGHKQTEVTVMMVLVFTTGEDIERGKRQDIGDLLLCRMLAA